MVVAYLFCFFYVGNYIFAFGIGHLWNPFPSIFLLFLVCCFCCFNNLLKIDMLILMVSGKKEFVQFLLLHNYYFLFETFAFSFLIWPWSVLFCRMMLLLDWTLWQILNNLLQGPFLLSFCLDFYLDRCVSWTSFIWNIPCCTHVYNATVLPMYFISLTLLAVLIFCMCTEILLDQHTLLLGFWLHFQGHF